jgi:hypothetical protein
MEERWEFQGPVTRLFDITGEKITRAMPEEGKKEKKGM